MGTIMDRDGCYKLTPASPSVLKTVWLDRLGFLFPMRWPPTGRTAVLSSTTHSITLLRQASSSSGVSCRTHVFMLLSSACAGQVSTGFSDTSHAVRYCVGAELQK